MRAVRTSVGTEPMHKLSVLNEYREDVLVRATDKAVTSPKAHVSI